MGTPWPIVKNVCGIGIGILRKYGNRRVFVSKDLSVASKIASTDAVFKTALMFFYERIWSRIAWGKEYLIEFSI